jgi:hypothetical protein
VSAVSGRADAWLNWDDGPWDTVGKSLAELMRAIHELTAMARRRSTAPAGETTSPPAPPASARPR